MVKKFKSFVKEEDLKDFEEDVLGETPPNTADAMKRHKAGKAGFTDKAHLKAKGLIPRSDGKKKVSDKYRNQADWLLGTELWEALRNKIHYKAEERICKSSKGEDDLFFGKAMLYNLDLIEHYLKELKKIK